MASKSSNDYVLKLDDRSSKGCETNIATAGTIVADLSNQGFGGYLLEGLIDRTNKIGGKKCHDV